jgi:pyruvate dehydrogenase E1 component
MDAMFKELGIYSALGQNYEPVDHDLLLSYKESTDGQILEEGITEAGGLADWTAAATSYAHRGVAMIPFFTFYSMFGFQRVGDLIWAAADARARGFLMGATAGRTTLQGEGLQHNDGQSLVLSSVVPVCRSYDPTFAFETALIVHDGIHRMYPGGDATAGEDIFYYITLYNENYPMPAMPADEAGHSVAEGVVKGLYRSDPGPSEAGPRATILFSGAAHTEALKAQAELTEHYGVSAELWSATSYQQLRVEALEVDRWNSLHPNEQPRVPWVTSQLERSQGPIVAVTDFMRMVPDQVSRWSPRAWHSLGTDGFGRSDTRETLRHYFETDAPHIVLAVLNQLVAEGTLVPAAIEDAISRYDLATEGPVPWHG